MKKIKLNRISVVKILAGFLIAAIGVGQSAVFKSSNQALAVKIKNKTKKKKTGVKLRKRKEKKAKRKKRNLRRAKYVKQVKQAENKTITSLPKVVQRNFRTENVDVKKTNNDVENKLEKQSLKGKEKTKKDQFITKDQFSNLVKKVEEHFSGKEKTKKDQFLALIKAIKRTYDEIQVPENYQFHFRTLENIRKKHENENKSFKEKCEGILNDVEDLRNELQDLGTSIDEIFIEHLDEFITKYKRDFQEMQETDNYKFFYSQINSVIDKLGLESYVTTKYGINVGSEFIYYSNKKFQKANSKYGGLNSYKAIKEIKDPLINNISLLDYKDIFEDYFEWFNRFITTNGENFDDVTKTLQKELEKAFSTLTNFKDKLQQDNVERMTTLKDDYEILKEHLARKITDKDAGPDHEVPDQLREQLDRYFNKFDEDDLAFDEQIEKNVQPITKIENLEIKGNDELNKLKEIAIKVGNIWLEIKKELKEVHRHTFYLHSYEYLFKIYVLQNNGNVNNFNQFFNERDLMSEDDYISTEYETDVEND